MITFAYLFDGFQRRFSTPSMSGPTRTGGGPGAPTGLSSLLAATYRAPPQTRIHNRGTTQSPNDLVDLYPDDLRPAARESHPPAAHDSPSRERAREFFSPRRFLLGLLQGPNGRIDRARARSLANYRRTLSLSRWAIVGR